MSDRTLTVEEARADLRVFTEAFGESGGSVRQDIQEVEAIEKRARFLRELLELPTPAAALPPRPVDNRETAADPVDNSGSGPQRQIGTFSCDVNQLKDLAARNGVIHKQSGEA